MSNYDNFNESLKAELSIEDLVTTILDSNIEDSNGKSLESNNIERLVEKKKNKKELCFDFC